MPVPRAAAVLTAGLTAVCATTALTPTTHAAGPSPHDDLERAILRSINHQRALHGLAAVRASRPLARAADDGVREQARRGKLSHAGLAQRVRRYTRPRKIGETLAWLTGPGRRAPVIVRMWMRSPSHRTALLTGAYRRVGIGRGVATLHGLQGTVVVADFST